jgi:hypothetical protein
MVIAAEFAIGGIFSAVNEESHLHSGKNVVPHGWLKFEETGSHAHDRCGSHWI